jgi:hypothetical protein
MESHVSSAFRPCLATTGIGSVPFADGEEAVSFLLDAGLSIPFWPQLPRRCYAEEMVPQFSAGIPCVAIDADERRVSFDPSERFTALAGLYEKYLQEDPDLFATSSESAAGLHAFERMARGRTWPFVKGQITGPITICTSILSADKSPLYGDPDLRDAAIKTLVRSVQWQIERLKPLASERVLMFVDEPVLAAYGSSSYVYLSEDGVLEALGEVFAAIHGAGAVSAIHVCGNSDWGLITRSGVQVVNFDAYQYGASISLYPSEVRALLDRGGSIAWGIVPTTAAVNDETVERLLGRFNECCGKLSEKGIPPELLRERALLTPSCGTGNLSPDEARRVFQLLVELKGQFS